VKDHAGMKLAYVYFESDWDGHVLATDKRVQGAGLSSYENDGAVSSKSLRASTRARSQSITSRSGYLSAMRP
jgi:hypothetical protein